MTFLITRVTTLRVVLKFLITTCTGNPMEILNKHHVLFPRKMWDSQDPTKRLRQNPMLRVPIDDTELHASGLFVPVPPYAMAERIERLFVPVLSDYIGSLENFARAVEQSVRVNSNCLERHLGDLIVASVLSQRPYIADQLNNTEAA